MAQVEVIFVCIVELFIAVVIMADVMFNIYACICINEEIIGI
jgi:hypothetical protein